MSKAILTKAGLGAVLVGVGLALMMSAQRDLRGAHEIDPETTAQEVAEASAERVEEAAADE